MLEPITLQHGKPGDVGMDPARIELIRTRARSWVANDDTRSVVLLVARRGVIVLKEASDAWDQGAGGATSISHLGALVSNFWADPDAGVVGVYLSVMPRFRRFMGDVFWRCDHFQDMVHASIVN